MLCRSIRHSQPKRRLIRQRKTIRLPPTTTLMALPIKATAFLPIIRLFVKRIDEYFPRHSNQQQISQMGICRCKQRTKSFCFDHKKAVCEDCIVEDHANVCLLSNRLHFGFQKHFAVSVLLDFIENG